MLLAFSVVFYCAQQQNEPSQCCRPQAPFPVRYVCRLGGAQILKVMTLGPAFYAYVTMVFILLWMQNLQAIEPIAQTIETINSEIMTGSAIVLAHYAAVQAHKTTQVSLPWCGTVYLAIYQAYGWDTPQEMTAFCITMKGILVESFVYSLLGNSKLMPCC